MAEPVPAIDGSAGEGGGQVLRSSLAMSLVTGRPFVIENIRAGRKKPGLMRQHVTAVFSGFGQLNVRAEEVATRALDEAQHYLAAGVPVGPHLADQLMLPLGIGAHLGGGGAFRTTALSPHSTTHVEVLHRFLEIDVRVEQLGPDDFVVRIG